MKDYAFETPEEEVVQIILNGGEKSFFVTSAPNWVDTFHLLAEEIMKIEKFRIPITKATLSLDGFGNRKMVELKLWGIKGVCTEENDNAIACTKAFIDWTKNLQTIRPM